MAGYSPSPVRPPKPLVPAWVLSIMIHATTIFALCVAIQPVQHGTTDVPYGSMGLVVHRASDTDTTGEFDRPIVQQTAAIMEAPAPPLLFAAAPVESNEPANKQERPAQLPKSASNASSNARKTQPKQTKPS